jgi:DNA invertase Pin-like site-specific DNA recombinase
MSELLHNSKIMPEHLSRKAILYLRQSSDKWVRQNKESQRLQHGLAERRRSLRWREVEIISDDLDSSAVIGPARRGGVECILSSASPGEVGISVSQEASRLSCTDREWRRLFDICQVFEALIGDGELVLGIEETPNVAELRNLRQRLYEGQAARARRGEPFRRVGSVHVAAGGCVFQPDRRVCEAIQFLFAQSGVMRQVSQQSRDHDVELPTNPIRGARLGWRDPSQSFIYNVLRNSLNTESHISGRHPVETHGAKTMHVQVFYPFHTSILQIIGKPKRRHVAVSAVDPTAKRLKIFLWMLLLDSAEVMIAEQAHLSSEALLNLTSILASPLDTEGRTHDNLAQTVIDGCKGGYRAATTTSGPDPLGGAGGVHRRHGSSRTGQADGSHSGGGISSGRRKS